MKRIVKIISIMLLLVTFIRCGEDNTVTGTEFGKITGRVVKANTFEPIENVKISLSPTNNTTFTDENGEFVFEEAPVNDYSAKAEKEGFLDQFEGVSLEVDATVNVVFEMQISTVFNNPPKTPTLLTPEDGVVNQENSVEFKWSSSDPDGDPIKYRLEVRNDFNSDVFIVSDLTDTTYVASNLKFGAKYFWQVSASDNINPEVLSQTFSFTVKSDPENRFTYTKLENGNNVIYSSSLGNNFTEINTVRLTETSQNSWRPRKNNTVNKIAFLRTDNNQTHIFTMKPNGEDVTRVTSNVPVFGFNLNEVDFAWSPTGDKFIYPSFDKLYMINLDGSGLQMIHQTTNGHLITECAWSSDGGKIALRTNNSQGYDGFIYTIDMSGNLVDNVVSSNLGALGGLEFSVDGSKLLYTKDITNFQSNNYRRLDNRVFLYDFTAMSSTIVDTAKLPGTNDLDPRYSPNEAEIIFVNTSNDGVSEKKIFKASLMGVSRQELFSNSFMPDWE